METVEGLDEVVSLDDRIVGVVVGADGVEDTKLLLVVVEYNRVVFKTGVGGVRTPSVWMSE